MLNLYGEMILLIKYKKNLNLTVYFLYYYNLGQVIDLLDYSIPKYDLVT